MNYLKLSQPQKTIALALAIAAVYGNIPVANSDAGAQAQAAIADVSTASNPHPWIPSFLMPSQAIAKSPLNTSKKLVQQTQLSPKVEAAPKQDPAVPNEGSPRGDQRESAGTRGLCPRVERRLTALVPLTTQAADQGQSPSAESSSKTSTLGLTVNEHPTFWFYVPYSLTPNRPIEFVVQDEQGKEVYSTLFTESGTAPGVVGLKLPSTAAPLELNKKYHWFFLVYCDPEDPVMVDGWVQRRALEPSLKRQLEQATSQEKVSLYAQADIWHEAMTSLAELRRQKPEDATLKAEWTNLLKSIDLEAIATEPITAVLSPTE